MNEVEGHYSFWHRKKRKKKKEKMVKKEKDQSEYSKTVRTVDSPMDGQILMHFILFFYFFLNEI